MNQQDYLERQFEMMGKAMASILAKLMKADNVYLPFFITTEFTAEERELLDVDNWPPKSREAAEAYLSDPRWNNVLSEQMIELLLVIAEQTTLDERNRIIESIQHLLGVMNDKNDTISFNRLSIQERVDELKKD
ncbi:MAG: hypothetical protein HOG66_06490 [Flavobacteriales bacterium]|nr:hypothetical protein [Flavobacteriales bacterium]